MDFGKTQPKICDIISRLLSYAMTETPDEKLNKVQSPETSPGHPDVVDLETDAAAKTVRDNIRTISVEQIAALFEYNDEKTGYRSANIQTEDISSNEESLTRYRDVLPCPLEKCVKIEMDIVDEKGTVIGNIVIRVLFDQSGNIYVDHDSGYLHVQGSGFGVNFQRNLESRYRELGVKAIVRGCGRRIGRYEGAKSGFDFAMEGQRQRFIAAFCDFLTEKEIAEVVYKGQSVPISMLRSLLHTPQDILAVEGALVPAVMVADDYGNVIHEEKLYSPGKAFFLDQGSKVKQAMPDFGKWVGIKRLSD